MELIPLALLGQYFSHRQLAVVDCLAMFTSTRDAEYLDAGFSALADHSGISELRLIELEALVFGYGAKKYAAWNWAKGMPWSVPLACIIRHLMALERGDELDPESGLPHVGHIACNLRMLMHYVDYYPEGDDLFPPRKAD